jgi:toxin CcdB
MPQFGVHRNPNASTRAAFPFLLDVQSELMSGLASRVVVPLCPASIMKGKLVRTLMPTFTIEGKQYVMLTAQLAGISIKELGASVLDLSNKRVEIVAALDLLFTGI